VKEPRFFAFEQGGLEFSGPGDMELHRSTLVNLEDYQALFCNVSGERAVGEASPVYLCSPKAAGRIKSFVPEARLIAILRHPVDRAYSHYLHQIRDGVEPLTDFSQALQAEEKRVHDNWEYRWRYKELGFYAMQLRKYFDTFDRKQMKIYLYEDFNTDPQRVLRDVYRFLGVDDTFVADTSVRYNMSGVPRSKVIHAVLSKLQKATQVTFDWAPQQESDTQATLPGSLAKSPWLEKARQFGIGLKNRNLVKPPLALEVQKQLLEDYREDILILQDLIRQDLSRWFIEPRS
jgi:hypothetical protein